MTDLASDQYDFAALSLRDLVEARDLYHFHLMNKANVVGTAVGLYLIRDDEDWPRTCGEGAPPLRRPKPPRTLGNSQVRDYSWPCIIVLVREWIEESAFAGQHRLRPWDAVPKRIYLPDGRAVPVCTVLAPPVPRDEDAARRPVPRPQTTFGGGLPIHVTVQGEERFATIGCLIVKSLAIVALARTWCSRR